MHSTKKNLLAAAICPIIFYLAYCLDAGTINIFKHDTPGLEFLILGLMYAVQFVILDFKPTNHFNH
jgi:hypothetical protein